jgi:hypothetical protein
MTDNLPAEVENKPPTVTVPVASKDAPVREIPGTNLTMLAHRLMALFDQYRIERRIAEERWLRNQRQYLGIYDPEIEQAMNPNRSKAYPKITRVKCITVVSHMMNLLFPGNERNWELKPGPPTDISLDDVKQAIAEQQSRDQAAGVQPQPVDADYAMSAVHELLCDRAEKLSCVIDDQLEELGGDQHYDYIALNREVIQSGTLYGLGLLRGPFAVPCKTVEWSMEEGQNVPMPKAKTSYKPMFEFVSIWDFYPDLTAKTFGSANGYFLRKVMSKSQVIKLKKRPDFFAEQIDAYLDLHPTGNYKALEFEWLLRVMGVRSNVNDQKPDNQRYEIKIWCGKLDGRMLELCGCDVDQDKLNEELDAEVWFIDDFIICCKLDPWAKLKVDVNMLHWFLYDKDDTSPIGYGLPNAIRDSQMMVSAATRMLLDNASVTCGPNLELNTALLRADQDLTSLRSYRMWYRDDSDVTAQWPAVRNVQIDSHMKELMEIIQLGLKFADTETFVNAANGADPSELPSEPMRTASGASMLRGNAALPFKDMVRGFDRFTQSVLQSIVAFNRVFNPNTDHNGDYNVIARGATSLIAKEVKGEQADQLAQTLTPEEKIYVDAKKLLKVRLRARDMDDIMVSDSEAARRQAAQDQDQQKQEDQQDQMQQAQLRKLLTDGYKNMAAGQKNISAADATTISAFIDILERGAMIHGAQPQLAGPAAGNPQGPDDGTGAADPQGAGPQPSDLGAPAAPPPQAGGYPGQTGNFGS